MSFIGLWGEKIYSGGSWTSKVIQQQWTPMLGLFFFLKQARYPSFDSLHVSIGQLWRSIHVFTWYDIKIVLPSTGLWTFLLNLLNTYNLHFFFNIILWNWLHFFKHNFVKLDNCYIWYTVNQNVCICGSAKIFPHKTS